MIARELKRWFACGLAFATLGVSAWAAEIPGFDAGRQAYEQGNHADAAKAYQAGLDSGFSPGLLHNLGNAEYKVGRLGSAVLAWERAHSLDPKFKNTVANLRYARGHAGLSNPELGSHEEYSKWLAPNTWLWTAAIAFWAGLGLLVLPGLLRVKVPWAQGVAVFAMAVFLLTLPALAGLLTRASLGVVMVPDAELRLTPTAEGEVLGKLPEGDVARVEKTRGQYVYVRAENDRAGWLKVAQFTRIWP